MAMFYPDNRGIRRGPSGSAERARLVSTNRVPHAGHRNADFPVKSEINVLDVTSERVIAGYISQQRPATRRPSTPAAPSEA